MIEIDKVYNCDCRDLMRAMIGGGVQVDCVITDPPYLIEYASNFRQNKNDRFCKPIIGDNDEQLIKDYLELCEKIMKPNSAIYVFCGSDKVDVFKREIEKHFNLKNIIVWVKNNWTAGDIEAQYGKQYEFCVYANKGRRPFSAGTKRLTDVWNCDRCMGNEQIHQNQKPLDLIMRMIKQSTNEGDLIFDGFMGSFTTAVACHKTKRHYIGAEIDKGYYELGVKRLNEETNQISLFD